MSKLNFSIKNKLLLFSLLPIVVFLLISVFYTSPYLRNSIYEAKENQIFDMVNSADSLLRGFYQQELTGEKSRTELQQQAIAAIKNMRYGPDSLNYFWLTDHQPALIAHPFREDLGDMNLADYQDPDGLNIFLEFSHLAQNYGGGFISYQWQFYDDIDRIEPKLSYVKSFEPWGWIVGTGMYTFDIEQKVATQQQIVIVISLVVALLVSLIFYFLGKNLVSAIDSLKKQARKISQGGLEKTVDKKVLQREDELGSLGNYFELMRQNLHETMEKLQESEKRYRFLYENSPVSIIIHDKDTGAKLAANSTAYKSYGYKYFEELKNHVFSLEAPYSQKDAFNWIKKAAKEGPQLFEWKNCKKNGTIFWQDVRLTPVELNGKIRVFSTATDITDRVNKEKKIEYLSFHDPLTKLYNRRFFEEELKRLNVARNIPLALLIIDVNGLKLVNDAFGHTKGDEMIRKVANVLKSSCRADDIISRIGGDEFAILLPKTSDEKAFKLTKRIHQQVAKERIEALPISLSCGWSIKKKKTECMTNIFKQAEDNMYKSKISDRSSHRHHSIKLIMGTLYQKMPLELEHSNRVSELSKKLGLASNLSYSALNELATAATLHDIGKIAIADDILNKKSPLSSQQWQTITRHPEVGYSILSSVGDYAMLAEYVLAHHERWDGKGYPRGLKAKEIPLISRIITIADAFDAMTNNRPYRKSRSITEALAELKKQAGSQFDPDLIAVFLKISIADLEKTISKTDNVI